MIFAEDRFQQPKTFHIYISPIPWICKPKDIVSNNVQLKLHQVPGHTLEETLLLIHSQILMAKFLQFGPRQVQSDMNLNL